MPIRHPTRYGTPAIALHWLQALLILGALGVGFYMTGLSMSPTRLKLYNWHKWAGVTILLLSAARLLWRLTHQPPADAPMAAVPLVGWAYSSAAGFPIVWFGVLPLPDFVSPDKALAEAIKPWHGRLAYLMAIVVLLHVAAALKHQFVDRDGLLLRMLPQRGA
jgi:cytochrome b561